MFENRKYLSPMAPLFLALGLTGAAFAATGGEASDAPLRCEIKVGQTGGMISLEGSVETDTRIAGSYRFAVASAGGGGNSRISQGGAFTATPGEIVTLGRVMLGANGVYDASLELVTDAGTVACEERAGRL